jgi:hypothetical protein
VHATTYPSAISYLRYEVLDRSVLVLSLDGGGDVVRQRGDSGLLLSYCQLPLGDQLLCRELRACLLLHLLNTP